MQRSTEIFAAIAMVLLIGCGEKSSFPPSSEWIRFNSPDAPYSVLMPGKPVREEVDGGEGVVVSYTCNLDQAQAVITSGVELPPDFDVKDKNLVSERLNLAVKAAAAAFGGEVLDKKNLIIDKIFPARDCTIKVKADSQVMIVRMRLVLAPDKLIQLFVVTKEAESDNPLIKKCLDSIKIKLTDEEQSPS